MRTLDTALVNFAAYNNGKFPNGKDGYEALAKLYPDYCADGDELAGLTGNVAEVKSALRNGKSISNLSSWIYIPGLQEDDDGQVAILWESKWGLSQSGRSALKKSRPVLLLDRNITNVNEADWVNFIKEQEALRKKRFVGNR